jgi:hypothetical protein
LHQCTAHVHYLHQCTAPSVSLLCTSTACCSDFRKGRRTVLCACPLLLQFRTAGQAGRWKLHGCNGCVYFLKKKILCKQKIPVTSNLRYMHWVLNVDEIKKN